MVNRKFSKTSDSLTILNRGVTTSQQGAAGFRGFPLAEEVGVTRYTRLVVGSKIAIYAVYNEYTKKFTGLAANDGSKYRPSSIEELEKVINESKGKK